MRLSKILVFSIIASLITIGCSKDSSTQSLNNLSKDSTKDTINLPTYIVSVMNENPPYVMRDEKGNASGLEIEILKAIGERQKFNISVISQPWTKVFESLTTGKGDIVTSGLFLTPERIQKFDVTRPYVQTHVGALVPNDNSINNISDLKGKMVVGREGSNVFEEVLKKDILKSDIKNTKGYTTTFLAVQAMVRKEANAVFAVETTLKDIQSRLPQPNKYKFIQYEQPNPPYIGFFVKKGRNDNLIQKLNLGIEQISKDGTLDKIMSKWTGEKSNSLPPSDVLNNIK